MYETPTQPHKTYVMTLHIFDIVYILQYNSFKLQQLTTKIHRRVSEE